MRPVKQRANIKPPMYLLIKITFQLQSSYSLHQTRFGLQ